MDLELQGDFLTAAELGDALERQTEILRAGLVELGSAPWVRYLADKGRTSAAGALTLNLGSPSVGYSWDVRRVNITPVDPRSKMCATVRIYRHQSGSPFHFIDGTSTLPAVSPWTPGAFPLFEAECLLVTVTGATAATDLIATASVMEAEYSTPVPMIVGQDA